MSHFQGHGAVQRHHVRGDGGGLRTLRPQDLQTPQNSQTCQIPAKPPETADSDAQGDNDRYNDDDDNDDCSRPWIMLRCSLDYLHSSSSSSGEQAKVKLPHA